jgi:hypothetical protein
VDNPGDKRFLMWGQLKPFHLVTTITQSGATFNTQLIKVNERIPNVWRMYLWLQITAVSDAFADGDSVEAVFSINFGVGEAQTTRMFSLLIGGPSGTSAALPIYANSDEQGLILQGVGLPFVPGSIGPSGVGIELGAPRLVLPAQSINVGGLVTAASGGSHDITFDGNVGAFVAPMFSPIPLDTPEASGAHMPPGQVQWMPPGFHDEPLGYRR